MIIQRIKQKFIQGFTLIEVGMAIAVASLLVVAALYFYNSANSAAVATGDTQNIMAVVAECETEFTNGNNSGKPITDCTSYLDSGIPSKFLTGTPTIGSSGILTITLAAAVNGSGVCKKIISSLTGVAASLTCPGFTFQL